jgi:hypothetical protein
MRHLSQQARKIWSLKPLMHLTQTFHGWAQLNTDFPLANSSARGPR